MTPPPPASRPPAALTLRETRDRTARALAAHARASCELRRQELLDYVVSMNMWISRALVARCPHRGLETEDLLAVADAALTRAARDFEPDRHGEFLSYAVPTIRAALKKHLRSRGWTARLPDADRQSVGQGVTR
jgi:RNA polymerase sigma-B factor